MTSAAFIRADATPAHRAAARELATALAVWTPEAFAALAQAFRTHLTSGESVMVAFSALRSVEPVDLPAVLEAALPELPAGWPEAPFLVEFLKEDAALWAAIASPEERRAYAMASLAHMSEEERHAIVRALEGRIAA